VIEGSGVGVTVLVGVGTAVGSWVVIVVDVACGAGVEAGRQELVRTTMNTQRVRRENARFFIFKLIE